MDIICIFSHKITLNLSFTTKKCIIEISQPPLQTTECDMASELCITLKHNRVVREALIQIMTINERSERGFTKTVTPITGGKESLKLYLQLILMNSIQI